MSIICLKWQLKMIYFMKLHGICQNREQYKMHENRGTAIAGLILIIVGALFLLDRTGAIDFHFWRFVGDFWPVILIILGLWIIYEEAGRRSHSKGWHKSGRAFGDVDVSPVEFGPKGLNYSVSFGEVRVSLGDTKLNPGKNSLRASSGFGEIKITVPENIPCKIHCSYGLGDAEIFGKKSGGFSSHKDYQDPGYETAGTKLSIRAKTGFGSIKIKRI